MSEITVEQKLELIRQIRSSHLKNQSDLSTREQILYGRASHTNDFYRETSGQLLETEPTEQTPARQSFGFRLFMALFLLAFLILWDVNGTKIAGVTTEKVFTALETNLPFELDQWLSDLMEKDS